MSSDLGQRFGFVAIEVGRLYGKRFDQLARQRLGLTRAQCRLIAVVAAHEDRHADRQADEPRGSAASRPLSQAELAQSLDLSAMAVTTLCERMAAAGWIARVPSATDRRAWCIALQPRAREALRAARALSDEVQAEALAGLGAVQRQQLLALLRQAHANLQALHSPAGAEEGTGA